MELTRTEIATQYFEAFYNANNPTEAKGLADHLLSNEFVDYSPAFGATPDKNGFLQTVGLINTWFKQDYKVEKMIVENDLYTGIWKASVEHIGTFMGVPPTHKKFVVNGITIYQIKEGKIIAHWEQFDVPAILMNLGILND